MALAEALDCPLVTLDRRLSRASAPTCGVIAPPRAHQEDECPPQRWQVAGQGGPPVAKVSATRDLARHEIGVLSQPAVISRPAKDGAGLMVFEGDDPGKHLVSNAGVTEYDTHQRHDVLDLHEAVSRVHPRDVEREQISPAGHEAGY